MIFSILICLNFALTILAQHQSPVPFRHGRIIGGTYAPEGSYYPWHVFMHSFIKPDLAMYCGGSLITTEHVLTSVHCTWGKSTFDVFLGIDQINKYDIKMSTSVKIEHPKYNHETKIHDVAILVLPDPVCLTIRIQTIPLAPPNIGSLVGTEATVIGFGRPKYGEGYYFI